MIYTLYLSVDSLLRVSKVPGHAVQSLIIRVSFPLWVMLS